MQPPVMGLHVCAGVLLSVSVPVWLALYAWGKRASRRKSEQQSIVQEPLRTWLKPRMVITAM